MDQQYFGVSLEKLLTSGGQTFIYGGMVIDHRNHHRNYSGSDPCAFCRKGGLQRIGFSTIS